MFAPYFLEMSIVFGTVMYGNGNTMHFDLVQLIDSVHEMASEAVTKSTKLILRNKYCTHVLATKSML